MFQRWRGSGRYAAAVPPMDGVLGPNQLIEEAPLLLETEAPDNLVADGDLFLFSTGNRVMRLGPAGPDAAPETFAKFEHPVSALALAADGALAVGLDSGAIHVKGGPHDGTVLHELGGRDIVCPTELLFDKAGSLLVALGSQQNPPSRWRHDLMEKNASGSVWRLDLASGEPSCIADGLAWPAGMLAGHDGQLTVSESWRNRLVDVCPGTKPKVSLSDLPGYPGRLSPASDGGAWLSVFAPRSQLVEFVLREDDYRCTMMAEVEPDLWIAPSLTAAQSFLEPMQLGGLKQLGVLKPWAPTRSYGLAIGLDCKGMPRASFHSRADGTRHGITSALEIDGRLLLASKGGNAIVSITLDEHGAAR
ncbi:MAG: strictosidine synthase [Rhizobiaceae bacterium]|nr:strictosidine synthase [Rhizobiaceae bacterium]